MERYLLKNRLEAGCDEAGRGCLAGPVYSAAVILPPDFDICKLNDSKKLSAAQRQVARGCIEEQAVAWAVAAVSPAAIDEHNILQAAIMGMHRAVMALCIQPEHLLIDGPYFRPYAHVPHTCLVKGDARFASIAAASILAKTHRDEYMRRLHLRYPDYGWDTNMGYPTSAHRAAIKRFGVTRHHRLSFKLSSAISQPSLFVNDA